MGSAIRGWMDVVLREASFIRERRQDIAKVLSSYKQRDDVFVSFRNLPKLGINPQSSYNTPIGIYSYPLRAFWNAIEGNDIPFAGNEEYVIVFQANGNYPDADPSQQSGYTQSMLNHDSVTIRDKYLERYRLAKSRVTADHTWGNESKYINKVVELLKADPSPSSVFKNGGWAENMINRKMDLDDQKLVADIVHEGYLTQHTIDQIKALVKEFDDGAVMTPELAAKLFNQDIGYWAEDAKSESPAAIFWNMVRNLAILFAQIRKPSPQDRSIENRAAVVWNSIMRDLGYDGFTDLTGTGLIHENEPVQAVFFSTRTLKLIEILPNHRLKPRV